MECPRNLTGSLEGVYAMHVDYYDDEWVCVRFLWLSWYFHAINSTIIALRVRTIVVPEYIIIGDCCCAHPAQLASVPCRCLSYYRGERRELSVATKHKTECKYNNDNFFLYFRSRKKRQINRCLLLLLLLIEPTASILPATHVLDCCCVGHSYMIFSRFWRTGRCLNDDDHDVYDVYLIVCIPSGAGCGAALKTGRRGHTHEEDGGISVHSSHADALSFVKQANTKHTLRKAHYKHTTSSSSM